MRHTLLTLLTVIFCALPSFSLSVQERHDIASNLRASLAQTKSGADSIKILFDIYDVLPRAEKTSAARELYLTAKRNNDISTCLEITRMVSAINTDINTLAKLEAEVKKYPDSPEKQETLLLLQLRQIHAKSTNLSDKEVLQELSKVIARYESKEKQSKHLDLIDLYTVTAFLRNDTGGELLLQYADKLYDQVSNSKFVTHALPNFLYAQVAETYSDANKAQEAIAADKKLQQVVESQSKKYKERGRPYRNYSMVKYRSYRRMLRNYDIMTPAEARAIREDVYRLAEDDPDVMADIANNPTFNAYYHMSAAEFQQAIPYLKQIIEEETSISARIRALDMLQTAASKAGDQSTLIEAMNQYIAALKELDKLRDQDRYSELQIRYNVTELNQKNQELQKKAAEEEELSTRRTMSFLIFSILIVAIIIVIFLYFWTRHRMNTTAFNRYSEALSKERNLLRDNIYRDYANPNETKLAEANHKKHKKSLVRTSTELLNSIFNDLLYISSLGRKDRVKYVHQTSVKQIMESAAKSVEGNLNSGVKFEMILPDEDTPMRNDSECVIFVLSHILKNSARHTTFGTITFTSRHNKNENNVVFRIKDSGETVPVGDEQFLFEGLTDINTLSERESSGLFYCRLNSMLLKCDLKVLASATEGTTFVLTVPLDLADNLK